ncbi:MAG TPA: TolC family protein [Candidatus Acidoferrales bacterium]|nr:TolC family protein [Candidatus Acidoferrales bacterium]HTS66401.1 TolC family protein [Candidatus Acidoferrales bacterium]
MQRILSTLCLALAAAGVAGGQTPPAPALTLTLEDALKRAHENAQQLLSADLAARIAHEDRVQTKAALLPAVTWLNGYVYTQPNGTDTGIFVANNGPHEYINMANVHADIYSPGKRADYQMAIAAEAVARAKVDIARRGLDATVVQNYYGMVVAQRKVANARRSLDEVRQFLDITQKQEAGGETAHSDVVKAMIQTDQRLRDLQDAQLNLDKARVGFAVFLFPDFRQDFAVVDDLDRETALPTFADTEGLAQKNNPDIRAAEANVNQESYGIKSARSGLLPTLSVDYFFGLDGLRYAIHDEFGNRQVGSSVVANLNVPVWNWGSVRSKMRQAEFRLQQAKVDLSLTQRQLLANLNSFYLEAQSARLQIASLKHSLDLSEESLKLTLLRYQAGEVTVLEVVDAQSTLIAARNAYDDGLSRYRLALAALQTLTGVF